MKRQLVEPNRAVDDAILRFIRKDNPAFTSFDWDLFLKKSFQEGVSGLIFYNLSRSGKQSLVPPQVYQKLEDDYIANTGRNVFVSQQLEEIIGSFQRGSLRALLLRGAAFFNRIYPHLGIRSMGDIDFVVCSSDHGKAKEIFSNTGYEPAKGYPFLFYKRELEDKLSVDLHLDRVGFWRIPITPFRFSINNPDIWNQSVSWDEGRPCVKMLSVYDAIFASCIHMVKHSFQRLIWFIDIVELINHAGASFNWDKLIDRAKAYRVVLPTFFVLSFINQTKLLSMPEQALTQLGDFKMSKLQAKSYRKLLDNQRQDIPGSLLYLSCIPGFPARVKFLWKAVFMEKEKVPAFTDRKGVKVYVRRFFKIVLHNLDRIVALLRP